jgi:apolipoprotein N-acyltransferase
MMTLSMAWIVSFAKESSGQTGRRRWWERWWRDATAIVVLLVAIDQFYGVASAQTLILVPLQPIKPIGRFLLVQGTCQHHLRCDPGFHSSKVGSRSNGRHVRRLHRYRNHHRSIVLWPESIFGGIGPYMIWDRGSSVPSELGLERHQLERVHSNLTEVHRDKTDRLRSIFGPDGKLPKLVMGTDVIAIADGRMDRYNAALWIDNDASSSVEYYAKHHLVMFGEYIPVLSWFPDIMKAIGLGTLSQGDTPKSWRLNNGAGSHRVFVSKIWSRMRCRITSRG